jgi:PAS domain S-box-containing protein
MRKKGLSTFQSLFLSFLIVTFFIATTLAVLYYLGKRDFIMETLKSRVLYDGKTAVDYFSILYTSHIVKDLNIIEHSPTFNEYLKSQEEDILLKPTVERLFLNFTKATEGRILSLRFIDRWGKEKIIIQDNKRSRQYTSVRDLLQQDVFYREIYSLFEELKTEKLGSILFKGPFKYQNKDTFVIGMTKTEPEVGGFGGVVIFHYDLTKYLEYVSNIKYKEIPIARVYDAQKNILFAPAGKRQRAFFTDSYDIKLGEKEAVLLRIEFHVPDVIILQERAAAVTTSFFIGGVIIFLVSIIVFFISRQFTRPIVALASVANRIAKGDLSAQVKMKTSREMQTLVDSFNKMTEDLQRTTVSIQTMKSILENMPFGVIVVGKDTRIRQANKAALSLLGFGSEREIMGKAYSKICPALDELAPAAEQNQPVDRSENVLIRRNGKAMPVLRSVLPITIENEDVLLETFVDITERKKAEEEIKQAMAIKSEFTSVVSHELRTPLTAIKESIGIVLDGSAGSINDEQEEFLHIAKRNVDRLARLINDVLDYQRLDAGRWQFDFKDNDINKLIIEIRDTMLPVAKDKKVDLEINLQENLPIITFDYDRIVQVLTNLVNNAIKFTDKGSITLSSKREDNIVNVSIKDTGIGIKEEHKQKLFKAFSQIATGGERKMGSTGLGLSISKKIVEQHGGKIWVDSDFGRGSTFSFCLPVQREENDYDKKNTGR